MTKKLTLLKAVLVSNDVIQYVYPCSNYEQRAASSESQQAANSEQAVNRQPQLCGGVG